MTKKTTTPEETALFRETVGTVKEIRADTVILRPSKSPPPRPKPKLPEIVDPLEIPLDDVPSRLFQEDQMLFAVPGVQKNVLKKLRKGHYDLDAEIDLHGLSSRSAQSQLLNFLHRCVEKGCRCLLVIHGKGYNSPDQTPVLKNDINIWLRQHRDVLAFCSAPRSCGGAGALLVLLRLSDKFADKDDDL
ncbi:DNA mismatch repair protein MutS [Methylomonas sp. LWB]|uniref:Smr/MutS family protein n=1 Tax=Methylomonas sp. LWB TaxID=1905845 RepID=UPI0008DA06F5|nr:Smr/MutS family protein [Methylomonas sp. LWB]OHX35906.1 DNA mismatch repair protein MutS [Methylomonas sp. LWB]